MNGLEPLTSGFGDQYSSQLSYICMALVGNYDIPTHSLTDYCSTSELHKQK